MFLVTWAEMARPTKPNTAIAVAVTSRHPCFRRSLLSPRRPGSFHPSLHHMYIPVSELPPPPATVAAPLLSRMYYVPVEQVHRMQSLAATRTKLECFSAFLWKMVAHVPEVQGVATAKLVVVAIVVLKGNRHVAALGTQRGGHYVRGASYYDGNMASNEHGMEKNKGAFERFLDFLAFAKVQAE
ncbi:Hydroxycinnamoyl-Coenzyme A shikimate/quinate hydroxycinnamoyltransferase [Spatholobus suberectus]|nr:Hydroxycinnamoyl-Coenzyme A shikimate/quinate hydroxycinnamoyltransferase [Spatholobus suberectus]